jgi:2'-hydroxyisoflavone reductase
MEEPGEGDETSRRGFLKIAAAAGGAIGVGLVPEALASETLAGPQATTTAARGQALRILILGGTSFIGPHQVRVVIDNSASNPEWVRLTAQLLKDSVDRYFYVSSRSAYADTSRIPMTADAPAFTYESAGVEPDAEQLPYGLRKALSEREAQRAFPDRATVFRPGLIIGPRDETDRFTYWPVRIHRGGEVLAPGDPSDPVQIIDARDFSEWMIRMAEDGHTGVFNAVGPATPRPMAELLYGIRAVTTAEATFTWVPADFLFEIGIRPYSHMPVWMPPRDGREGFARFDLSPEVALGLTFRPLAVTTRDTLDYHFSRPPERQAELRAGISAEREAEVLAAWHSRA